MIKYVFLVLVAVAVIVGYKSLYIIQEFQQVVVTEFGKPVVSLRDAGLYFKLPWQKVLYFDKRLLKIDGEPNEIPTNDKTFIWVDTTARWKIIDPLIYFQRLNNERRATSVISDLIEGIIRDLVTKNDLNEIIISSDWKPEYSVSTEREEKIDRDVEYGRDGITTIIIQNLQKVESDYGINIIDILIKRINYTDKVRQKVYERMISERKRIAAQKRSQGEGEKAEILGKLSRELSEINSNASRVAQKIRGKADARAANIYGESYNKDPEFYRFYETLKSYEKTIGGNTKLVVDVESPLFSYFSSSYSFRK